MKRIIVAIAVSLCFLTASSQSVYYVDKVICSVYDWQTSKWSDVMTTNPEDMYVSRSNFVFSVNDKNKSVYTCDAGSIKLFYDDQGSPLLSWSAIDENFNNCTLIVASTNRKESAMSITYKTDKYGSLITFIYFFK